ncbi:uncharacterized protein LOC123320095 [Coccinella septempunctata]|uniref:uncharacterized protein LOC123320095 n=1 Tax=Coccinella septempunctata TaxID=41139 RepID=UPI001D098073|nr:uncharacterized protein LOC123320095 [Coccinella septempunctata]
MRLSKNFFLQNKLSFTDILRNNFRRAIQDPRYSKTIDNISSKIDATGVKDSLYKNIISINQWYTRVLGLDEVKQFQDRVILLQEKLLVTQEKRREIGAQLSEIRKKSYHLQDELQAIKRQEEPDKYFKLMKEETELLKLEHEVNLSFQEYDKAERDLFTAYSNAVRDSHEKYRSQMEYTKYFGIILSITGSFLAFTYTTLRKHDLKMFIDNKLESLYGAMDPEIIQTVAKKQAEICDKLADLQEENKKLFSSLDSISFERSVESKLPEELNLVVDDGQGGLEDNRTKLIIGFSFCLIFIGYVLGKIDR